MTPASVTVGEHGPRATSSFHGRTEQDVMDSLKHGPSTIPPGWLLVPG